MNLDIRIKSISDIFTCTNIEEAKQFIGKRGYFADCMISFEDLSQRELYNLDRIDDDEIPFVSGNVHWRYFLPVDNLKPVEKKYRPYTLEEFLNEGFEVLNEGLEIVVFREKGNPSMEYHVRYNGYRKCDNVYKVILGNISYMFSDLFEDFERFYNGRWYPFGVKEE